MSFLVVLLVPLLVMLFALGMERLEAQLCGSAQRDDELDGLLADDVTEQATRLIPVLTDTPPPLANPAPTVPTPQLTSTRPLTQDRRTTRPRVR